MTKDWKVRATYVIETSHATDVASQASATGMIFTWDAMLGDKRPIIAEAQASDPWARERMEMKTNKPTDFEKRMIRHAIKC